MDEIPGRVEALDRLFQINDVDPASLAENKLLHLRTPAFRLMPEMDTRFQ
jgi:hypothetical protein